MPDAIALRCDGVSVSYGRVPTLFSVDLDVRTGELLALLGTNGAGKSTILKTISGLLRPSAGTVTAFGERIDGATPHDIVRRGLVQVPGGRGTFAGLTVEETIRLAASTRLPRSERRAGLERAFALFPALAGRRRQVAGTMSGGQQQMLLLARAMVAQPRLLMIDELSLGLAPVVVDELLDAVAKLREDGVTLIVVEQHVDLALSVADRAVFLEKGEVRFSGPAHELRGRDDLLRSVFLAGATEAIA